MEHSEDLDLLAQALIKAQNEMGAVVKSETVKGKSFSYQYATFEDILEVIKKPLADNGLVLTHMLDNINGAPAITTFVVHTSGQFMQATIPLVKVSGGSNAAQALGIVITYTKRYGTGAVFALPIVDDTDGRFADDDNTETVSTHKKTESNADPLDDLEQKIEATIQKFGKDFNIDKQVVFNLCEAKPLSEGTTADEIKTIGLNILLKLSRVVIDNEIDQLGLAIEFTKEVLAPISKAIVKAGTPKEIIELTEQGLALLELAAEDSGKEDKEPEPKPAPKSRRGRQQREPEPVEESDNPDDDDDTEDLEAFDKIPFGDNE